MGNKGDDEDRGDLNEASNPESTESPSEMKRAAARTMIEKFFYQLIEGCGNPSCTNENCASSNKQQGPLSRNEAAAKALELFHQKAKLCEASPSKQFRPSSDNATDSSDSGSSVSTNQQESICKTKESSIEDISFLTEEKVQELVNFSKKIGDFSPLVRVIGRVFSNWQALNVSFLKTPQEGSSSLSSTAEITTDSKLTEKERQQSSSEEKDKDETVGGADHSCRCKSSKTDLQVDIESVQRTYKSLYGLGESRIENALHNAIISLSQMAEVDIRFHHEFQHNASYLNCFLIIFENHMLQSAENLEKAFPSICHTMSLLPLQAQVSLTRVWSGFPAESLKKKLEGLQQLITFKVLTQQIDPFHNHNLNENEDVTSATKLMKLLYYASILGGDLEFENRGSLSLQELLDATDRDESRTPKGDPLAKELGVTILDCRKPLLPLEDFYNEPLSDSLEVDRDFTNFKKSQDQDCFAFLSYPFILTPSTKSMGLFYDNRIRMFEEQRMTVLNSLIQGEQYSPYLKIKVKRDQVVEDALIQLELVAMENPSDLKKQLYVEFEGEQGVDEGGVSKEFFQLIVEEIFNPDIGMFILNESTRCYWFNPNSFETDRQFKLIGIVLGLAIYNNVILDASFPMVLYRKLMGRKGTFQDLEGVHPVLYSSLKSLLNFEGNVEETFLMNFEISYTDVFGNMKTHSLKKDGENIKVNNSNRQEFVNLYADFLVNKHIECQFREFKHGFDMVTSESALTLWFSPYELDLLVCGSKDFNFLSLEDTTEYDGGYTRQSQVIKNFWEVVHGFDEEKKKKLLMFATGSDRVPVGGLAKLRFIITKSGPDSDRLPASHTCFNVLLLPEYSSKEKLEERLLKAITHAKGFGML